MDKDIFYSNDKTTVIGSDDPLVLGLINSRLLDFVMHSIASTKQGGYYEYKPMYIGKLPIKLPAADKTGRERLEARIRESVETMVILLKRGKTQGTEQGFTAIQRQIDSTDKQNDAMVYELYGLSEEEIRIVEESVK